MIHVETDRSGTELVAFAGTTLALLSGALPWTEGGTGMPPSAAAITVLCGVAAGAVLLYGDGRTADYVSLAGLGGTVGLLVFRAHGAVTSSVESVGVERTASGGLEATTATPSAGLGVFVAALAGIALAAAGAHECWKRVNTGASIESTASARSD